MRADLPGTHPRLGAGGADAGQAELVTSDLFDHPPRGRGGGHAAEQPGLVTQDGQVAEAVAAVGQHHRKVAQHPAGLVAMAASLVLARPPAQRGGQPEPVGQLGQQRRPGVAGDAIAIGGDLKDRTWADSLHPQGAPLEW